MWGGVVVVVGSKVQVAVPGRGGTDSRYSAREETAGRSRRPSRGDPGFEPPVENGCPSSLKLGKAGAGSQCSSREETDGVGGHRSLSARGGELLRIRAVTHSPKPVASAPRRPSSASPAHPRSSTMTEDLEKKKCQSKVA